jgi:hypothetical protein
MRRRRLGPLALLALAPQAGFLGAGEPVVVGSWRLVSNDEHRTDGTVLPVWGSHPAGRLVYDAGGRMSIQLMDPRRGRFASADRLAGTTDETKQAFDGYLAYFGSYTVDAAAGTVTHHVEGSLFPNLIGSDQRRSFVISGNRLTLTTPPILGGGRRSSYVLVWQREE